jgi:hypothetical protein
MPEGPDHRPAHGPDPMPDPTPEPALKTPEPALDAPTTTTPAPGGVPLTVGRRIKNAIDTLLVIDVFVVIAGALWFAVALLLHTQKLEGPLNLFQTLWEPLFTPAIGLLMGAAVLSGILGWWQRRGQR